MGKINCNMFYLTQSIEKLLFEHVINMKIINELFYIFLFFFCTMSSKVCVYFTFIAHLNLV